MGGERRGWSVGAGEGLERVRIGVEWEVCAWGRGKGRGESMVKVGLRGEVSHFASLGVPLGEGLGFGGVSGFFFLMPFAAGLALWGWDSGVCAVGD